VEEEACPEIKSIIQQVRQTPTAPERPDQVFYRIMDHVVDSYLPILDHFDDLIDALEDEALENPTPDTLSRIFQNKRALATLRRVLVTRAMSAVTCRERSRRTSHAICGRSFATSTITWRAIWTSSR
jgi:Mg2+ and Co2+ transporter CorA